MILDKLVEFVHGPHPMAIGTRDSKLRPSVAFVAGAVANASEDTITMFLPVAESERTTGNLEENGVVALTVCEPMSHETYQFKGRHVSSRPTDERTSPFKTFIRAS